MTTEDDRGYPRPTGDGRTHRGRPDDTVVGRLRRAGCVFAEEEAALLIAEASSADQLGQWVTRRSAGEPLEYIVGWAAFCGSRIVVAPGVFVPRRRTELLVDQACGMLRPGAVVVDLCCGSGAVAAGIAAWTGDLEIWATDLDPAAVACAERNLAGLGTVLLGDLDAPLPDHLLGRVDVLVANAPYVPTAVLATMPPEARDHESRLALDGGDDGVDLQRRVAALAPLWLAPAGRLLIETSRHQADLTVRACARAGLLARIVRDEEIDATVVVARRPDAPDAPDGVPPP